jgi:hypothetical protein
MPKVGRFTSEDIIKGNIYAPFIKLMFIYFAIPSSILANLIDFVDKNLGSTWGNLLSYITFLHIYFIGGVYSNYSHWKWRQKNIRHLL